MSDSNDQLNETYAPLRAAMERPQTNYAVIEDNLDVTFDEAALDSLIQSMSTLGVSAQQAASSLASMGAVLAPQVTLTPRALRDLEDWRNRDIARQPVPTARDYVGASTSLGGMNISVAQNLPPGVLGIMRGADGKMLVIKEDPPAAPTKTLIELD